MQVLSTVVRDLNIFVAYDWSGLKTNKVSRVGLTEDVVSHVPEPEMPMTLLGMVFEDQRYEVVRVEGHEGADDEADQAHRPSQEGERVGKAQERWCHDRCRQVVPAV